MAVSPQIAAAFEAWKFAELACYYAEPCPDALMDRLVTTQGEAFDALQALPPASADDMLLKLFPLLVRELEPLTGAPPLCPAEFERYDYGEAFHVRFLAELGKVSPTLAAAIAEPHPSKGRAL